MMSVDQMSIQILCGDTERMQMMKGRVLAMCCSVSVRSVLQLRIVPFHSSASLIWVQRGASYKTTRAEGKGYELKKK